MSQLSLFNLNFLTPTKSKANKHDPERAIARGDNFEFLESPVQVIRRPYQRTITISVRPNGMIRVTASRTARAKSILRFLDECRPWLQKVLADYESLRSRYPKKRFIQGEKFLYLGDHKTLRFVCMPCRKWQFEVRTDELVCKVPNYEWKFTIGVEKLPHLKLPLLKFYENQGRRILRERVEHYSKQMDLYPTSLSFRSQKTRWGSCSSRGTISLNWRLIAAPLEALDYVVVHELAHLRHPNHSKTFWRLVEKFSPNYAHHRKWLRDHQYEFDFLAKKSELHDQI